MARGICYNISKNIEDVKDDCFSESDLYDQINELCVDYVEDMEEEDQKESRKNLLDYLRQYGFKTGCVISSDGEYSYFSFSEDARKEYFANKYEMAQAIMNKITLDEFATSDMWELCNILKDDSSDCIYDTNYGYAECMDSFLRYADPNEKYYLGNTVFMH